MKKYKNYIFNQQLRKCYPSVRKIRNGKIKLYWEYEPFVPPVFYNYPIAVRQKEMVESGCPHCGYRSGSSHISMGGAAIWRCGSCGKGCEIWHESLMVSPFNNGQAKLIKHPRLGTPSHGKPDKVPKEGGEYFSSRGIGIDSTPGCFVCGGEKGMRNNISGYVHCKEAGERIVGKFEYGARLDYREHEPDYIQVKIGACHKHCHCLEDLDKRTHQAGGRITNRMIAESKKVFGISDNAKSNLNEFKRTNKLQTSIMLQYVVYFNDKSEDEIPEEWKEVGKQVRELQDLSEKFNEVCWKDIHNKIKDLDYDCKFQYENSFTKMTCMTMAGRILIYIIPYSHDMENFVGILGTDGKEYQDCELHECNGLFQDLKNMLVDIIECWNIDKFVEHEKKEIVKS